MIKYSASYARLTFHRDSIEPLNDNDSFEIFVSNDNEKFRMTKKEFHQIFDNVISSDSYKKYGVYNYKRTPSKAYEFLVR